MARALSLLTPNPPIMPPTDNTFAPNSSTSATTVCAKGPSVSSVTRTNTPSRDAKIHCTTFHTATASDDGKDREVWTYNTSTQQAERSVRMPSGCRSSKEIADSGVKQFIAMAPLGSVDGQREPEAYYVDE